MPTLETDYGLVLTDNDATPVIPFLLAENSRIEIQSIAYTGSLEAMRLVGTDTVITGPDGGFTLPPAVFLSSGGTPGTSNTSGEFTVFYGTPGDADLDATASAAFVGAGTTQDAAVLEFSFSANVAGSMRFQLAFGSDEFPEFSDTEFVDIAAVYVNGTNYALFNEDPAQPLSIINTNLSLGNFVDNTSGAYGVEYDGFAPSLVVFAPVVAGQNTVKIAIADTGDTAYDSGVFVSNLGLDGTGAEGTFVPVIGTNEVDALVGTDAPEAFSLGDGDDSVSPGLGNDSIDLGSGSNTVLGSLADLSGDVVVNFDDNDKVVYEGVTFGVEDLTIEMGSAIVTVDVDGDGIGDATTTFTGDFSAAAFSTNQTGGGTELSVQLGATAIQIDGLVGLYDAVFDREPDGDGYNFWNYFLVSNELALPEIADFFVLSPEFVTKFGTTGPELSTDALVDLGYQNVLGRDPDADGDAFWSGLIDSNEIDAGDFFASLATSEEFQFQAQAQSSDFMIMS